jgi:hypothetical protein
MRGESRPDFACRRNMRAQFGVTLPDWETQLRAVVSFAVAPKAKASGLACEMHWRDLSYKPSTSVTARRADRAERTARPLRSE